MAITLILGLGNIGKKYDKTRHNLGFEVVDRVVEKLGAVRQKDGECFQWWKGEVEVQDEEGFLRRAVLRQAQDDGAPRNDVPLVTDLGSHSKLWGTEEGTLRQAQGEVKEGALGEVSAGAQIEKGKRTVYLAKPTTYMNGSGEAAKELMEQLGITPAEILVIVDDFQIPLGAVRFRPNGSDGGHNGLVSVIEELGTQAFPRLRLGIGLPQDKAQVIDYVLTKFNADEKPTVEKMLAIATEGVIFALQHRLEKVMSKYNFNPAPPDLA